MAGLGRRATPRTYGADVTVRSDDEWKPRSIDSTRKPAARIAASVSRVVRQPPSDVVQKRRSALRCTARNNALRDRTCPRGSSHRSGARGAAPRAPPPGRHRAEDAHHDRGVEGLVRRVERDGHARDDVDRHGGGLRPRPAAARAVASGSTAHGRPRAGSARASAVAEPTLSTRPRRPESRRARSSCWTGSGRRASRRSRSRAKRDCSGP